MIQRITQPFEYHAQRVISIFVRFCVNVFFMIMHLLIYNLVVDHSILSKIHNFGHIGPNMMDSSKKLESEFFLMS